MAECNRYLERMAERLGGEPGVEADRALELHLSACSSCKQDLEAYEQVVSGARTMQVPEPPESYWSAFTPLLRGRIAGEQLGRQRRWQWLLARPAVALASAAFVLLAVLMVQTPIRPDRGMEQLSAEAIEDLLQMTEPLDPAPELALFSLDPGSLEGLLAELDRTEAWGPAAGAGEDPFSFLDWSEEWSSDHPSG